MSANHRKKNFTNQRTSDGGYVEKSSPPETLGQDVIPIIIRLCAFALCPKAARVATATHLWRAEARGSLGSARSK